MGALSDYETLAALLATALEGGAERKSISKFEWVLSADCESPHIVELYGRPQQWSNSLLHGLPANFRKAFLEPKWGFNREPVKGYEWSTGRNHPLWFILTVACRKCHTCRAKRAAQWREKARSELSRASRTWFCTFTLSPDEQFRFKTMARVADHRNGDLFEQRTEEDKFRRVCDMIGPEITRYVKRVRKQSGAPLRYLFVTEKHISGDPHFHALIHEVNAGMPLRKAVLKEQWLLGFTRFKLVDEPRNAAWYLCKYISKEAATRVRCSLRYGKEEITTCVDSNAKHCVKTGPKKDAVVQNKTPILS